jgi:hypothetical protein
MSMPSHASDSSTEWCWRWCYRGDLAVARCWCQVMLAIALPWRFGRGTMLMPSHAGDDAVVAIWLWHDVYAESCWRQCYQVMLVTALLIPSNGAAEATLVVAQCSCWVMLMTVLSSHVGDGATESCWRQRYRVLLVMALPRRCWSWRDVDATRLWHDVTAESF